MTVVKQPCICAKPRNKLLGPTGMAGHEQAMVGDHGKHLGLICRSDLPGYDYKTSTGIGLRYSVPPQQYVQDKPPYIPAELRGRDPLVDNNAYRPVVFGDLDWKLPEPFEKNYRVPFKSMLYIKPYGEKVKAHPPNPPRVPISENREQYQRPWPLPQDPLVDLRDDYLCMAKKDTNQPLLTPGFEYEGYTRLLDPYNTVSHLTHHYIQPADADFYRSKPIDISPILAPRIKPVYDKLVFRAAFSNNAVHRPHRFVPHSSLKSETSDSFRHPLTMSDLVTFDHGVEFKASPHAASSRQVMATPAMYLTEYTHISEGWPVNAAVQYGDKEVEVVLCES